MKLKIAYIITAVFTIPSGLLIIFAPELFSTLLDMPAQDQLILGIVGSVWLAFGILSILGLRNPEKFMPILLFQFTYKVVWTLGVLLPIVISGQALMYTYLMLGVFLMYIVIDIFVVPWSEILE